MNEQLKPCTKCGASPEIQKEYCKDCCASLSAWCGVCKESFGYEHYEFDDEGYSDKLSAQTRLIEAWNTRA